MLDGAEKHLLEVFGRRLVQIKRLKLLSGGMVNGIRRDCYSLLNVRFPGATQHHKRVHARLARATVVRRRTGIVTYSRLGAIPDLRCTVSRCTASGKQGLSMPLEILHRALVPLGRSAACKRTEIAAASGFWVLLARVNPVLARCQLADHDRPPEVVVCYSKSPVCLRFPCQ